MFTKPPSSGNVNAFSGTTPYLGNKKKTRNPWGLALVVAPRPGLEPGTCGLTAGGRILNSLLIGPPSLANTRQRPQKSHVFVTFLSLKYCRVPPAARGGATRRISERRRGEARQKRRSSQLRRSQEQLGNGASPCAALVRTHA